MFRNLKVLLVAVVVLVVMGSTYAFAAANEVEDSTAGYTGEVVPGFTVSDVVYDLDAVDPTVVDEITFTISPSDGGNVPAAIVKLQTAAAGGWTDCTLVETVAPTMDVTCGFGTLLLSDITALNIVASSSLDPAP